MRRSAFFPVATLLAAALTTITACTKAERKFKEPTGPSGRIFVDSVGRVTYNGTVVDSAALADSLRALVGLQGAVIYSRANPARDPNPAQEPAMRRVMAGIIENKLPIRLVPPESVNVAR